MPMSLGDHPDLLKTFQNIHFQGSKFVPLVVIQDPFSKCLSKPSSPPIFARKFSLGALVLLPGFKPLALQMLFQHYISFPASLKASDPTLHLPTSPTSMGQTTILIVAWTSTLRLLSLLIKKLLEPPGPILSFPPHTITTHQSTAGSHMSKKFVLVTF